MRLVYKPRFTRNAPNPPGPFQTHSLLCVRVGLVARSCLTLCDPMDCSQPGSSVHGIFQARILEWVAMPSFRGIFPTQDQTHVSCIASRFFAAEPLGKHPLLPIQFSIFSRLSSEQAGAWPKSHLGPRCHLNSTTFPREVCWYSFFTSRKIHLWPGCSFFFGHKTTWLAGSWFPNQGWNLGPLKWKPGSLNHWISKEFPWVLFFSLFKYLLIYLAAPGLVTCGILVPWPEIEPEPPALGVLATGSPGKSYRCWF